MIGDRSIGKAAVLGATGATGRIIAHELHRRGVTTRVVSRSEQRLRRDFSMIGVEQRVADLANPALASRAIEGCQTVFVCVGLPLSAYPRHGQIARVLADELRRHDAACVLISGYWTYTPIRAELVREDHPREPDNPTARVRRDQEDILAAAGAAVAVLPDFYGPRSDHSLLNDIVRANLRGRAGLWPGNPDAQRDFIFVPDIGPIAVDLATHSGALGKWWNIPGSGAISPREAAAAAMNTANGPGSRVNAVARWKVSLAGLFNREMRTFARDIYPIYENRAVLDGTAIRGLIGPYHATPYAEGLAATVEWIKSASLSRA